jgi:hypothetical protein
VADEDRMVSVARLVRELDDALRPLGIPAGLLPAPFPPDAPAPVWGPATQLSRRDVTPENVVFRQGLAYALIDFDLIQPSTRVQSVVNLLLWWAAWLDPADRQPVMRDLDPFRRGRLIVQAYELDDHDRTLIVPVALRSPGTRCKTEPTGSAAAGTECGTKASETSSDADSPGYGATRPNSTRPSHCRPRPTVAQLRDEDPLVSSSDENWWVSPAVVECRCFSEWR